MAHRGTFDAQTNLARREIIAGILSGMRFIHDHGYIHCDLKVSLCSSITIATLLDSFTLSMFVACACWCWQPGNVLLSSSGGSVVPKVSDMGLAVHLPRQGSDGASSGLFTLWLPELLHASCRPLPRAHCEQSSCFGSIRPVLDPAV